MERYSRLWWVAILLSSVVTGGGTFGLLTLFTDLPVDTVVKAGVMLILIGDIVLALMMEAFAPTRIRVSPGERRLRQDRPNESARVVTAFENGRGMVTIRGERWQARLAKPGRIALETGATVHVVDREGLTLVVESSADDCAPISAMEKRRSKLG